MVFLYGQLNKFPRIVDGSYSPKNVIILHPFSMNSIGYLWILECNLKFTWSCTICLANSPSDLTDNQLLLNVSKSTLQLKYHGDRSFSVVEPILWNAIPKEIRLCNSSLKSNLKIPLRKRFRNNWTTHITCEFSPSIDHIYEYKLGLRQLIAII